MRTGLERFAVLSGAVAGILWLASLFLLEGAGNLSSPATTAEIADFYRSERASVLRATTVHALAGFFFLWFVAALWRFLVRVDAPRFLAYSAVLGGATGGALMLALMGGHSTAATTDPHLLSGDAALVFWRIAHAFFVAGEAALAVFVVAVSLLALGHVPLPRWLGWLGLFVAVVLLIPPLGWLSLLFLFPVWLVLLSLLLYSRRDDYATRPP